MTHHRYISFIAIAGLISLAGWALVLTKLNPFEVSGISLALFFVTLFMSLTSLFTVLGYYFRVWLFKDEIFYKHINVSLRQGVFLGLVSIFALVLQMLRFLNWISGIVLILFAVFLEFYFSVKDSEVL